MENLPKLLLLLLLLNLCGSYQSFKTVLSVPFSFKDENQTNWQLLSMYCMEKALHGYAITRETLIREIVRKPYVNHMN